MGSGSENISNFAGKDFEVCQIHLSMEWEKICLNYFYMSRELFPLHHYAISDCGSQTHTNTLSWCLTARFGLEPLQKNISAFPFEYLNNKGLRFCLRYIYICVFLQPKSY